MCVASGSNPFPNVTLTSGTTVLTTDSANRTTVRMNYVDPTATVTRTLSVSASWTMTNQNVGSKITCNAGVKNPNATSNSFIVLADNGELRAACDWPA